MSRIASDRLYLNSEQKSWEKGDAAPNANNVCTLSRNEARRETGGPYSTPHPQLSLVGLDLFKQRFEVFFALSGVPGLVFDAGELLGNPIDYLTDVVVPALDSFLAACRASAGFWR